MEYGNRFPETVSRPPPSHRYPPRTDTSPVSIIRKWCRCPIKVEEFKRFFKTVFKSPLRGLFRKGGEGTRVSGIG